MASAKTTACFIPPMLLLKRERLPEGPEWLYEPPEPEHLFKQAML